MIIKKRLEETASFKDIEVGEPFKYGANGVYLKTETLINDAGMSVNAVKLSTGLLYYFYEKEQVTLVSEYEFIVR